MRESANEEELWRRLDWNDVRTFLAVARSGSLNAAARALGMTQPTISRRMEDLEYRLGARLFSRSSRGVLLTDAGELVRDMASSMARFGDTIMREVGGRDQAARGQVRVVAPDGLASFVLMPALTSFQQAHPDIHLAVDCGLWPDTPIEGETDLALEFTENAPADVVSLPIATFHYAYFAAPEYLAMYGTPRSAAEVAEHRIVHHVSHREQMRTWNPKLPAITTLASSLLVSNSSAATFMAIKHGVGLGVLPTAVLSFEPNLVMLDIEPMAHPVLFLRYRAGALRQTRVQRVKDWLHDVFDPVRNPWYREEFIHPRDFPRIIEGPGAAPAPAPRFAPTKLAG